MNNQNKLVTYKTICNTEFTYESNNLLHGSFNFKRSDVEGNYPENKYFIINTNDLYDYISENDIYNLLPENPTDIFEQSWRLDPFKDFASYSKRIESIMEAINQRGEIDSITLDMHRSGIGDPKVVEGRHRLALFKQCDIPYISCYTPKHAVERLHQYGVEFIHS